MPQSKTANGVQLFYEETSTGAGVGIGFKPPRFLKKGDTIAMEVDGIGRLSNPVA